MISDADTLVEKRNGDRSLHFDQLAAIRILHVEDDETIAVLTREMLEAQGWYVQTCANGTSALEQICSDARYDCLLVDYKLPDLNGLELVRRARTLSHRSKTLIAVISANSVEAEAREAGANVFLSKPQDLLSLPDTIKRLLKEHQQSS